MDAGAIVVGFDPSTYTDATALKTALSNFIGDDTKCLGATRGGGSFKVTRETREVEVDGKRYNFVGSTKVDSVDACLSTKLVEITKGNLVRGLASATPTSSGKKDTIELRTAYANSDYLTNLCWVG